MKSSYTTDHTVHTPGTHQARLSQRIADTTAVIGVVGLGYVGLPLAVEFAAHGFKTIGIDLNTEKILRLNAGNNYIQDVDDNKLRESLEAGYFTAEDGFESAAEIDIFFICVPTPITTHKDPDMTYIRSATEALAPTLRAGQLFILKSTTYPNTTEGLVQPILEAQAETQNLKLGRDFFLAFSPERIDPGNQQFTTANTPVVVGGVTRACTQLASEAMQQVIAEIHPVSSPKVAEMEKLLENTFRSVNIALVNELAQMCDRVGGISIWEVIEAAATKPFGFMPFYPGPGLGGHCIPIDPYYLSWLARKYDFETNFITLSARINEQMPYYVIEGVMEAIAQQPIRLQDAQILVLGVAFKKNVDDTRHSPALKILELLHQKGVSGLAYSDPHVPNVSIKSPNRTLDLASVDLSPETLAEYDVVIITTDHDGFPYPTIARHARSIIDTRNALKHIPQNRDKIKLIGDGTF